MCDPMTLGSIALSTAGGYYNGQTQANYVDAVNQANKDAYNMSKMAREAELVRQQALEGQNTEAFNDTLATMGRETADEQTAENAQNFTDTLNDMAKPTAGEVGFLMPGQGESSVAVKDWVAREANKAAGDASRRIGAMAQLSGMGTTAGARVGQMRDTQNEIATNNGIRRGSLGVSQFEQNIPAANVTPGSSILGDLLSGAGALMGSGAFGANGALGGIFPSGARSISGMGGTVTPLLSLLPRM